MKAANNKLRWVSETMKALTDYAKRSINASINNACQLAYDKTGSFRFLFDGVLYAPIDYKPEFIVEVKAHELNIDEDMRKLVEDIKYKQNMLFKADKIVANYLRLVSWKCNTLVMYLHQIPPILANEVAKIPDFKVNKSFSEDTYIRPHNFDESIENTIYDLMSARLLW